MIIRPIKVKVLNETSSKVLIYLPNSNSQMRVSKEEFRNNVKKGIYVVADETK